MTEKFITVKGQRVRADTIKKYEVKTSNEGKAGVKVHLDDGGIIIDWDQTVEDIDKQMEAV